ncbi:MAG: extracellular solute-binding protein [Herpetosiphonaceae bacterium]|nr:extracellular solute-binding protein [Herpetosiphonaceae bacterium]
MQLCPQCNTNNRDTAHHCAQCGHGLQDLLGAGTILQGRYQIERVLGTGGFGAVYLVRHLALGHLFALKTSFDTTTGAVRQFEREAKFLVTLQHPNLARVTDLFIEANGTPYLVMEYVEGENLDELVTRTGLQTVSRVITWMEQTLDALHYLHTRIPAIVHRDIKPSNLILQADGRLVLVDFGIAKESGTKTTIGARAYTPGFSPPEQYGTQSADARSDLYSVGATMFFLLTAQVPPDAIDRMVHGASLILPGSLPPSITQLVTATLALNPSQRPISAEKLKTALTAPVAPAIPPPQRVAMPIPPTVRVSPPPSQRLKWLVLLGAGAGIAVVLFFLVKLVSGSSSPTTATAATSVVTTIAMASTAGATVGVAPVATTVSVPSPTTVPNTAVQTAAASTAAVTQPAVVKATANTAPVMNAASIGIGATSGAGIVTSGEDVVATGYNKIGTELADAFAGKYKGKTVSVLHGFSGNEVNKFAATFKDFQDKTGITINLVPGGNTEAINVKVTSGTVEDIVNFPQPGTMASYAKSGKVIDLNKFINPAWLKQNYNQGFIDTNTVDSPSGKILGGVFERINFKSAVWYPKKAFDAAGYKVPTTWAEQQTLMDQIVKDGDTPWCMGIESGGATGWPATDWIEDLMLRTTSLDNYDKWVNGTLPFTSPEVKTAFQILTNIWFDDKYVYGGRKAIATTNFGDAGTPMLQDPPKCWLLKQGTFITTFFEHNKPGVKAGVDYDFYYLPPIDPQYSKPVLYAGDLFSAFNDRPEVRAVMEYFTTYEAIQPRVKLGGGALSPHKNAVLADYTNDLDRKAAQIILTASIVRFDGSDLMPAEVGSGSFWKGMTDYAGGTVGLNKALAEIQAGWDNVKK